MEEKSKGIFYRLTLLAMVKNRLFIACTCAILLLSLYGLTKAKLELDLYSVHDPDFASSVQLSTMREAFSDVDSILLILEPTAGSVDIKVHQLCAVQLFLERYNNENTEVHRILSPWSIRVPKEMGEKLWYPRFIAPPCEIATDVSLASYLKDFKDTPFAPLFYSNNPNQILFDVSFSDAQGLDAKMVDKLLREFNEILRAEVPGMKLSVFGQAAFRYYFHKIMSSDALFNLGLVVFFFVFLRLVLGTWKSGLCFLFTIFVTILTLYGTACLVGFPIDVLTNNLFLMTALAGTADFLFVSFEQFKSDYKSSFRSVATPCFFTSLTTFVGFVSLVTSDITVIQRFGVLAAWGTMLEWGATFLVLPAVLSFMKQDRNWVDPKKAFLPKWLSAVAGMKPHKAFVYSFLSLAIVAPVSYYFLSYSDQPYLNFPKSHEFRKTANNFYENRGWEGAVYLLFPMGTTDELVTEVSEKVAKINGVYSVESMEGILSYLSQGLSPLTQDLVKREIVGSPFGKRFQSPENYKRSAVYLERLGTEPLRRINKEVQEICKGECELSGQSMVYLEYGDRIGKTLIESFAVSLLLVFIILWGISRKLKVRLMPILISSFAGPLAIITLLAVTGTPVTLITSIFLAVLVGLTGDNAIQYMFASENLEEGVNFRAVTSVVLTVLLVVGSLFFLGQTLIPMKILGVLFGLGFSFNLFGDLWILRYFLDRKKPTQ